MGEKTLDLKADYFIPMKESRYFNIPSEVESRYENLIRSILLDSELSPKQTTANFLYRIKSMHRRNEIYVTDYLDRNNPDVQTLLIIFADDIKRLESYKTKFTVSHSILPLNLFYKVLASTEGFQFTEKELIDINNNVDQALARVQRKK